MSGPLPYHFNLQRVGTTVPFLASNHEACPDLLLVMARGGDHSKHPWSEGPSLGGRQLSSHWARMDTRPD
jgi:hypothetical protein